MKLPHWVRLHLKNEWKKNEKEAYLDNVTEEATGQSEQPSDLSVGNVILGNDIAVAVPISHPNPPHTHHHNSQTHKTGPELTKIKLRTALPASPHHKTFFCVTPLSLPTWELKLDVKTFVVLKTLCLLTWNLKLPCLFPSLSEWIWGGSSGRARSEAVSSETARVCDGYDTLHRTNSHRFRNQILLSAKPFCYAFILGPLRQGPRAVTM